MRESKHGTLWKISHFVEVLVDWAKNPLSFLGILLTTISAILIMVLFILDSLNFFSNPYIGMINYLILPGFFLGGLILIPLGVWKETRRVRKLSLAGEPITPAHFPVLDFNVPHIRRAWVFVAILTPINIMILSLAGYQGFHYMDSVEFCGTVCHSVMEPEHTAYQRSPHSRVACVGCHIGPGASWFVKSKLSGVRQIFAVVLHTYSRPIPTPVHNLRPARETCEQCHWPQKFHDLKLRLINKFSDDEKNTPLTTALLLKVGGTQGKEGHGTGIHWWHMDPYNRVTYIADEKRQTVYWVQHQSGSGKIREFKWSGEKAPKGEVSGEKHVMDCVDCHNRPTHIYQLPEEALDAALNENQIDRTLPFIKKAGVQILKSYSPDDEQAAAKIQGDLLQYYQKTVPAAFQNREKQIEQAGLVLQQIYKRNVFPKMRVGWGAYPNNLGHQNFPGCFRCHDGEHKSAQGEEITQDCSACHDLLAQEEEKPALIPDLLTVKK
jgi:hypothetical protein